MDPEFTKVLLRVIAVGGAIGVIGAGVLVLAFRSYGRDSRATLLTFLLLAFVLLCCGLLLVLSFLR
jgi:hypothetical protein